MLKMKTRILATMLLLLAIGLTGCHKEDFPYFHWVTPEQVVELPTTTPEPPSLPEIEPEVVPEEEVGESEPDPAPEPPCELIKGNISSSGEKIFHRPDGAYYDQVKVDESTGESFFCSVQEALDAGFRQSSR